MLKSYFTQSEADAINNMNKDAQNTLLGNAIKAALQGTVGWKETERYYVDSINGIDTQANDQGKSIDKPFATIQYALNVARYVPNTTTLDTSRNRRKYIFVMPGIYNEQILFSGYNISLIGLRGGSNLSNGDWGVVINYDGAVTSTAVVGCSGAGIEICGLCINVDQAIPGLLLADTTDGCFIHNNWIKGVDAKTPTHGIDAGSIKNTIIDNNIIEGVTDGIIAGDASTGKWFYNSQIINNKITKTTRAIYIPSDAVGDERSKIENNVCIGSSKSIDNDKVADIVIALNRVKPEVESAGSATGENYLLSSGGDTVQQLVTEQSKSGQVEEDAIITFGIGIYDIDSGAVASGSIDITGISATLYKSTGGGAFSAVGITQPTFAKANGSVAVDYRFLAAEWEIGDVYKLVVSGITVSIGGDTAYIKQMTWSNVVTEYKNVEGKIDAIQADLGDPSSRTNLQTIQAMLGNPDAAGASIYDNIGNYVGQTNLQSLLAALGIPDVAGKPLYTCLVTDRLDSATYGLNALKTLIDAVQTDLGDPSSRTNLQTILACLGNPDTAGASLYDNIGNYVAQTNLQSLLAALGIPDVAGKPLYTCLVTDRLDSATYGLSALKTLIDNLNTDVGDYSAQTNLQSLLAALGIPDVAGKPLYTCLVTDRLDSATYGLNALKTLIDAVQTDLGDPSSRTNLQTIQAMLGNPDTAGASIYDNIGNFVAQTNLQSLLAVLGVPDVAGKPLYTCLVTDRLDSATYGLSALKTLIDAIQTDIGDPSSRTNLQTIQAMLGNPDTAGRTIYAQNNPTISSSSFSYIDAGGVQDMVEVVNTENILVKSICVDCNTLTQNGVLAFWTKVDGTNYRRLSTLDVTFTQASDDSVCMVVNVETDKDFKFTWEESGGDEGAARSLPYKLSYETRS